MSVDRSVCRAVAVQLCVYLGRQSVSQGGMYSDRNAVSQAGAYVGRCVGLWAGMLAGSSVDIMVTRYVGM